MRWIIANMPFLCGQMSFNIFSAVEKILQYKMPECSVGKKSARWSLFIDLFLMSNGQLLLLSFALADIVQGLAKLVLINIAEAFGIDSKN